MSGLQADRHEIERFFSMLFRYADDGSYLSLRIFDQFDRTKPALHTETIILNGDADAAITAACRVAARAATLSEPAVFAPPVATFSSASRARTEDLCNGLTLSVELDQGDITAGRRRLEELLGPATLIMESGGVARDPKTDQSIAKLHLHWRLNEPTRCADDHQKLRTARRLAATLSGGDPTAAPPSHPLRWARSWNTKATPTLARIIVENPDAEIDLSDAIERIEEAIEAAGLKGKRSRATGQQNGAAQAPIEQIASALNSIPNDDVDYEEWVRIGYAVYAATGGTGLELFRTWSSKSAKHDDAETEATWARIGAAGPSRISVGTIFFLATQQGWRSSAAAPGTRQAPAAAPGAAPQTAQKGTASSSAAHGAPHGKQPNNEDTASPIDLQNISPIIAELITSATQDGRSVENRHRKLFEVVKYLRSRRHGFAAVLATLKAHPAGVQSAWIDLQRLDDEIRRIWGKLDAVVALIVEFNAKYFVVNENGRAIIYAPRRDPILNRRVHDRLTFEDLEKLYANRWINTGDDDGDANMRNVAKVWLTHPERRQFIDGITFDPACRDRRASVLNLWQGLAVKPRAGSWAKLQAHIRDVVCSGDTAAFEYLLDVMADTVQNPAKQGEVAVVLRGVEGCGKGIVARALKYVFGQHGLAISNVRHLTGNFNAHLRDCVFLFADEAFYAGDKRHVGVLKALVTEPYLTIEGKYQNAYQAPNFLHVWLASNEDWVVPASLRSRRWFALDVPDTRVGDLAYFAAIYLELENGGYAAMLHDLLQRDLSKSNLRAVPVTTALVTQRKRSLDTTVAWWMDCLHRGYVFASKLGLEDHWQQWHSFVPTEVLFASYATYCREHHERHPLNRELLGSWMTEIGAKHTRRRNQPIGEHIVDKRDRVGRVIRVAELVMHPHPHGYRLGALASARAAFCNWTKLEVDWGGEASKMTRRLVDAYG